MGVVYVYFLSFSTRHVLGRSVPLSYVLAVIIISQQHNSIHQVLTAIIMGTLDGSVLKNANWEEFFCIP